MATSEWMRRTQFGSVFKDGKQAGVLKQFEQRIIDALRAAVASVTNVSGGTALLTNYGTTYNPVLLYTFDRGTTNSLLNLGSAGSAGNLAVETGTEAYSDIFPGKQAFFCDGSTKLWISSFLSAAAINGDLTASIMIQTDLDNTGLVCFGHDGGAETEATNFLYGLIIPSTSPRGIQWISEHGGGVNDTATTLSNFRFPPVHNLSEVTVVRSGNNISHYFNGRFLNTVAITAPTGGGSGRFRLFGDGTNAYKRSLGYGFALWNFAMTDEQVANIYNLTMGPAFGEVTV